MGQDSIQNIARLRELQSADVMRCLKSFSFKAPTMCAHEADEPILNVASYLAK